MSHNKKYDYLVMIGDFAPFHNGYLKQVQEAQSLANQVIILINNCFIPRNTDVPFDFLERKSMILENIDSNVYIFPLFNYMYNVDSWIEQIQDQVDTIVKYGDKVGIFTNNDEYADMFPQWKHEYPTLEKNQDEIATWIRNVLYSYQSCVGLQDFISPNLTQQLTEFMSTNDFFQLVREYNFIKAYKEAWNLAPYAPTFCTSDCIVIQSGHILMVIRGAFPGEGQLALPGGFLEQNETFRQGAIRELIEETKIDAPKKVLLGNIIDEHTFDAPYRSRRGRTITHTTVIKLPDGPLPKVKGSDDAVKALFVPFSALDSKIIFEDHFSQIHFFRSSIKAI